MSSKPNDPGVGASTCTVDGVFPADAIAYLNRLADARAAMAESGSIVRGDSTQALARHVRRSDVLWLEPTPEHQPIYDLFGGFAQHANTQVFHFDLTGFNEPIQLATYRAEAKGHYDWHVDIGAGILANRKMSIVVPLSDPATYEGGDFQVFHDNEPATIPMPLGRIVAFPSYLLHRVTPVTRGVRRTLALWVSGPPFR